MGVIFFKSHIFDRFMPVAFVCKLYRVSLYFLKCKFFTTSAYFYPRNVVCFFPINSVIWISHILYMISLQLM